MSAGPRTTDSARVRAIPRWAPSRGLAVGGVVVILLAAAALLLSRLDLALLALPILIAVLWDAARRPPASEPMTGELSLRASAPGDADVGVTLTVTAPAAVEAIALRWTLLGSEIHELVLGAAGVRDLGARVPALHSGPQELVAVDIRLLGAGAAVVSLPLGPLVAGRVLAPPRVAIDRLPLPRRLTGLTGGHPSTRAGDGGEFRDVHPFTAGDRLRRIDWKASARLGRGPADLYVRRTDALSDATVLIVLDTADDVGERISQWGENVAALKGTSALDLAREAASSIAETYIRAGDRVGLQDLADPRRIIPHAGGGRHLWRLRRAIEATQPARVAFVRRRPPVVPAGALVYLLSALLDDEPVGLALRWRGAGHRVIAVDVLPTASFAETTRDERLAHRILMMRRADRIRTLRAGGVELLRWSADATGERRRAALHQLSRPPRGSRAGAP